MGDLINIMIKSFSQYPYVSSLALGGSIIVSFNVLANKIIEIKELLHTKFNEYDKKIDKLQSNQEDSKEKLTELLAITEDRRG